MKNILKYYLIWEWQKVFIIAEIIRQIMDDKAEVKSAAGLIYNHFLGLTDGIVTVIVAAGASKSLKTNQLIELIRSELDEDVLKANTMVHLGKRPDDCTLEELFSIFIKLKGEKRAYNFLNDKKDIYRRSDNIGPTKGYEYLAHLFHHGLVDYIITTNFDEELEISLDDELGKDNYRIIKSLSEFDAFNMEIERENEKPEEEKDKVFKERILFKVHGTISYPRTIRATIENVKKFEDEKRRVIKWVLCRTKVLIIVGFSFRDEDFRQVFSDAIKEKALKYSDGNLIHIFWIHLRETSRKDYVTTLNNMIRDDIRGKVIVNFIIMGSNIFFKELAEKIEIIDNNKKIPTIARQNIRELILEFSNDDTIMYNKFYIEIIIFAMTVRGLFGIDALTNCNRLQRYCHEIIKNGKSPHDLFQCLIDSDIISQLDPGNIYCVPDVDIEPIVAKVLKFFYLYDTKNSSNLVTQLEDQLKKLQEVFDVDVVEPDINVHLMFKNPTAIRNHKDWEGKTEYFVKDANILRIIAQTGEWIIKEKNVQYFRDFLKCKNKTIQLILCKKFENAGMHSDRQLYVENKLLEMQRRPGQIEILYLPWEEIF